MCGRYTLGTFDWVDSAFNTDLANVADVLRRPRFNVGPGQMVLSLTRPAAGPNIAESMHWGIDAPWKDGPQRIINARAEKLAESRFWKPLLADGRCAIPADGFFEWRAAANSGGRKQPYWFSRTNGDGFAFAGLWRAGSSDSDPPGVRTCAVITVEPNDLVAGVYPRMPAMLTADGVEQWLGGDVEEALAALEPFSSTAMTARAVGVAVGDASRDGAALIDAIEPELPSGGPEQSLF
jgi:putative SOS response-associated peptidase YedK